MAKIKRTRRRHIILRTHQHDLYYKRLMLMIYINTTGATSGTGTAYPSAAPEFNPGF